MGLLRTAFARHLFLAAVVARPFNKPQSVAGDRSLGFVPQAGGNPENLRRSRSLRHCPVRSNGDVLRSNL